MSIFVDANTKVVYQGLTGKQGQFYGLRNRDYGTLVVAGTSPKKAGTDVDGIPIFANVADAVAERIKGMEEGIEFRVEVRLDTALTQQPDEADDFRITPGGFAVQNVQ